MIFYPVTDDVFQDFESIFIHFRIKFLAQNILIIVVGEIDESYFFRSIQKKRMFLIDCLSQTGCRLEIHKKVLKIFLQHRARVDLISKMFLFHEKFI